MFLRLIEIKLVLQSFPLPQEPERQERDYPDHRLKELEFVYRLDSCGIFYEHSVNLTKIFLGHAHAKPSYFYYTQLINSCKRQQLTANS